MRRPLLRIHADELIVDGFAGGGGTSLGIEQALGRSPDVLIVDGVRWCGGAWATLRDARTAAQRCVDGGSR